jgi:hypothetical protein
MNPNWRKNNLAIPKPARIHSPDPFLRAGNAVSVLPNPNPQKLVWQNRVHRISTRIPSVSPLEKPDLARHHHTEEKKSESATNKIECVVARRGRNGTAVAERHCFRSVSERTMCRDGIRIGAYTLVLLHHALRACDIICFGNRCEFGTIQTQTKIPQK